MFSNKDLKVYAFLWVLAFIFFLDGWNAGWILDSVMHTYNVRQLTCWEYLHLHIDKTIRFFYHFTYYWLEKLLGPQGWDWYLFKISLHALNAFLLYKVCHLLMRWYAILSDNLIPVFSAVLFLLAPTSTDVVMYQAAFHFMLAFALLQVCVLLFFKQMDMPEVRYDILFYCCYLMALFTLEIAYVFNGVMCLLILLLPKHLRNKRNLYLLKYVAVPVVMTLVCILLNYIILHNFVGHYGAEKHFRLDMDRIVQNLSKIPLDLWGMIEYWNMDKIYKVYDVLYSKPHVTALAFVYLVSYCVLAYRTYKNPEANKIFFLLVHLIGCLALPTLSLGILYIIPVEEDRYYYSYAGFVYFLLLWTVYRFSPKWSYAVALILCVLGVVCLKKNVTGSAVAQRIIDNSIKDFPYHSGKRYMILAMPVYSGGVLVWDTQESRTDPFNDRWQLMAKALIGKRNMDIRGKVASVLQFNVINEKESPIIERLDGHTLKMTLPCCGKWWWKYNVGAQDYENAYYKVKMIGGWQQEVMITFKQKPADMIYLYQCGDRFCEFPF